MKNTLGLCTMALMLCACAGLPTSSPPHRHVYWDKPHSSAPTWFPDQLTWIQKVYYTLIEHFGSAIAGGFGVLFGPLGPFVSSFSLPYFSTYVSRLTNDVVARSLDDSPPILGDDNFLARLQETKTSDVEESSQQETKTSDDKEASETQESETSNDEEFSQFYKESSEEIAHVYESQHLTKNKRVFSLLKEYDDHYFRPKNTENLVNDRLVLDKS